MREGLAGGWVAVSADIVVDEALGEGIIWCCCGWSVIRARQKLSQIFAQ